MPEYKLQHWLPASYLQFFAVSGTPEGRDSIVYVTTSDKSETRKVKNVAASNFLYSRLDPKSAEKRFHRAEGDYPRLLRKALNGAPLQKSERMQLFLIMLDLHFRNPAYANQTSKERTDASEHMVRSFLFKRIVGASEAEAQDLSHVVDKVFEEWELHGVEMPPSVQLWTSDNPALLFSLGEARMFAFAILPVTPRNALIAYRSETVDVAPSHASEADARALNTYQVNLCIRELYSAHDLSAELGSRRPLSRRLSERPSDRGWVTDNQWAPEVIPYPHDSLSLGFVSPR